MAVTPQSGLTMDVVVAHASFDFALEDPKRLLDLHYAEVKRHPGRPSRQLEVFKRAAVILSVTAWESFIEDAIRAWAVFLLERAESPADVQKWFNSVAAGWLNDSPKPPALASWTAREWKALLRQKLEKDLRALNTPDSENIRGLSRRYLELDLTVNWSWPRTTSRAACKRLDDLIGLRGELVHNGPEYFPGHRRVLQGKGRAAAKNLCLKDASNGVALISKLAECTRRAVYDAAKA